MLKNNLKILRKRKGLSQEELSIKLHVVRQTISKWESGLSVPDAEMLIAISQIFETPVSELLGENLDEKEQNDLTEIAKKLEDINKQISNEHKQRRNKLINFMIVLDAGLIILFVLLVILKSPYLSWDYSNPEWSVVGTLWHVFEWIYFKVAPFLIIAITIVLGILIYKKNNK